MVFKLKITLYEADKGARTVLSELTSGDRLLIGRGQTVQVWINDKNISREHCAISYQNDQILIEDLKSRNGTFVNGQRIVQHTPLRDGDQVKLASTSYFNISFQQITNDFGQPGPSNSPAQAVRLPTSALPRPDSEEPTIRVPNIEKEPAPSPPPERRTAARPLRSKDFSLVGEEFNGYQIVDKIGIGGMAVVYKAVHHGLNRTVAVKTLAQRLIQNPKAVRRFLNVAKIAGQLSHPNIVQIYDSGTLDQYGIYYYVMEFVAGESLNNVLKENKKLPVSRACKIVGYIANALTYANKRNIIHRDINPSNILVGSEDVPKLIGLGLSKCLDDEMTALTQPGKGMGMVGYIAPEQLMDATQADHRSDIYSLGAVFYRCLCGQTPYDTKNMREYFNCIHKRIPPIPPNELNSEIPMAINDMILKTLHFSPEDRYQNAENFLLELRSYIAPRVSHDGIERARKQIMAMLPSRTSLSGFEFESIYRPAEAIGGDFYDFLELSENEIGISIADVTGHGVEAAVVVGMVKAAMKIIGKQIFNTAEVLRRVNEEIYPDLDTTTFATVFYGIINRKSKILRFSRAGHNPLILYNPKRSPSLVTYEPKGMVLGMFSRCECEELNLQLQSGDFLIQYTDGITEAMNEEQEEFGQERLYATIKKYGKKSDIKSVLAAIDQAVTKFSGMAGQQDDITLIGIKVR